MYETKKLKEERQTRIEKLRTIDAEVEKRGEDSVYTAEERQEFDRIQDEVRSYDEKIETAVRRESIPAPEERSEEQDARLVERRVGGSGLTRRQRDLAVAGWLTGGGHAQTPQMVEAMRAAGLSDRNRDLVIRLSDDHELKRAMTKGVPADGGYTVSDLGKAAIEKALVEFSGGLRTYASVHRTGAGQTLPIPTQADPGTAALTAELGTVAEGSDLDFGEVEITVGKVTSGIAKVSYELLQDSDLNMDRVVGDALAERIAVKVANEHVNGAGDDFQGLLADVPVNAAGIDVETPDYDAFVTLLHQVPPAYRRSRSCAWMFNDAVLLRARLIKDANGTPMWQPGMVGDEPDRLFAKPIVYCPELGDDDLIVGDLSKFHIRDVRDVILRRSDDVFFNQLAAGFVAFYRGGCKLVDVSGKAVVKAAAPAE